MNLNLPYITASHKNENEAFIYFREWKCDTFLGIINFYKKTVTIDNNYCDRFDKHQICLAAADDDTIYYYLRSHGLISDLGREFRDCFDCLYRFNFKALGKYEIRPLGDDIIIEVYDNEQEAEDRASYLTETDPDGEKYEVIVRGNPYEQYN